MKTLHTLVLLLATCLLIGMSDLQAQKIDQSKKACSGQSSIPIAECHALVDLYFETGGNNWKDQTNWLSQDPCTWNGVACYNGNVAGLLMSSNDLKGEIPESIGDFPKLRHLALDGNHLSNAIPDEIAQLFDLEHLYLNNNQLSGLLPGKLVNLVVLRYLDLSHNKLRGEIPALYADLNTRGINLSHNNLSGPIPINLQRGASQFLYLNDNSLSGIVSIENAGMHWSGECDYRNNIKLCMPNTWEYDGTSRGVPVLCGIQLGDYICAMTPPPLDADETMLQKVNSDDNLPSSFSIKKAYPNPFNPMAVFDLRVAKDQIINIELFDSNGKKVKVIFDGHMARDELRQFTIDGSDLPSGIYLYRISGQDFVEVNSIHLLK